MEDSLINHISSNDKDKYNNICLIEKKKYDDCLSSKDLEKCDIIEKIYNDCTKFKQMKIKTINK